MQAALERFIRSYSRQQDTTIPWGISGSLLEPNRMMETDTNLFTLARLNAIHSFAAELTQSKLQQLPTNEEVKILDLGSDDLFPLMPLLQVADAAPQPVQIVPVDLVYGKLAEGAQRPELQPYFTDHSKTVITPYQANGNSLAFANDSFHEARLIGVLDGTIYGDPKGMLKEMQRVLVPGGNALVSFRSPYLDRLLPAIARAGNHMLWNENYESFLPKNLAEVLQKGYPLSRRVLVEKLIDCDFSEVTFYGQLPVSYRYREFDHEGKKALHYKIDKQPQLEAIHYDEDTSIFPTPESCSLVRTQSLHLKQLKELRKQQGQKLFQITLQNLFIDKEKVDGEDQYTQYMFWLADITK